MKITGKTRICGLIGDPVEHSMSPAMHNAAFEAMNLDYAYFAFKVSKERLTEAIDGTRALNIRGVNVTIPHKRAVIPLMDNLDITARKIGAVNTIVNNDGLLTGYNTDATGFLKPLLQKGFDPRGEQVLVVGAGGAARAISFALIERGASLLILNRSLNHAQELAMQISVRFSGQVHSGELNKQNLFEAMTTVKMLVNATSVGMDTMKHESPVPAHLLKRDILVYDIVYNPLETRLLSEARAAGCTTINGIEMLVWQGALAFEKWTGEQAPIDVMRQAVIHQLENV